MNKNIVSSSKAQRAVFAIDHRLLVCEFYRVSSDSGHRSVIKVIRDAGANPEPYRIPVGNKLRRDFNRQG